MRAESKARAYLRSATMALLLGASVSACRERPQQQPAQPQTADRAIVAAPQPTTRCIAPEPDSAAAAAAAMSAMPAAGPRPLKVASFTRHHEGVLVSVAPVATNVVGGGGLVWVDRDGCITVIKLYE